MHLAGASELRRGAWHAYMSLIPSSSAPMWVDPMDVAISRSDQLAIVHSGSPRGFTNLKLVITMQDHF